MDFSNLTVVDIITAGAMGLSVVSLFWVFKLLSTEQEKEKPRPEIIKTIKVFMVFGILMTVVALGIEYSRHFMKQEDKKASEASLKKALQDLELKGFYSMNADGAPKPVVVSSGGDTFTICKAFPKNFFAGKELNLAPKPGGNAFSVFMRNNQEMVLGDLSKEVMGKYVSSLDPSKLHNLGLYHAPYDSKKNVKYGSKELPKLSKDYLNELLTYKEDESHIPLKVNAAKVLSHGSMINQLDSTELARLITAIKEVRSGPYLHWDLSEAYLALSKINTSPQKEAYLAKYHEQLKKIIASAENHSWITDTVRYPIENGWYVKAQRELKNAGIAF